MLPPNLMAKKNAEKLKCKKTTGEVVRREASYHPDDDNPDDDDEDDLIYNNNVVEINDKIHNNAHNGDPAGMGLAMPNNIANMVIKPPDIPVAATGEPVAAIQPPVAATGEPVAAI